MSFEWFVAKRYLRSPNRPTILRLITAFSILGVAAGVATLVVALAMNSGFRATLQDRLLGVTAHISLTRPGSDGIQNYKALVERLQKTSGLKSVTPAIYETMLLSYGGEARGVVVKGIDVALEERGDEALQKLSAGHMDFSQDPDGIDAMLVGKQLADEWRVRPGDYVTLTSPQGRLTPFGLMPRTRRFRIAGIFDSGFYDYDENWCFVTLAAAQSLAGAGDIVNVLEFRLAKPEQAAEIAIQVKRAAGEGFTTTTWMEQNRALFRALRLEKLVTAIFIGLITFVAGLNILVVLSMTVTDKAKDIAVLLSMGTRREQVRRIFLLLGMVIGATGTVLGLAVGYVFTWIVGTYHLIPLDPQVYAVPFVPFNPSFFDGLWIALAAMGIAMLATVIPAREAARLLPVEILRFE
ncbi:MAG: ABC transporter permease [Candidatus Acidiferrum sp.]